MNNLNSKPIAIVLFVLFAICFSWVSLRSDKTPSDIWSFLVIAYKTIPLVLMVSGFFVLHAWRWTIFRGWLVPFPDLNGTWIGNIQTTWTDPTSGKVLPPVPAILTIRQSFIHINCVVRTEEMTSHSYLASFWLDGDEQIRKLGYSYHSSTRPTVQDRSVPHDGTMVMELLGNPVRRLSGVYWTTRRTTGEAQFDFHSKERLDELPASLAKHPMGLTP